MGPLLFFSVKGNKRADFLLESFFSSGEASLFFSFCGEEGFAPASSRY